MRPIHAHSATLLSHRGLCLSATGLILALGACGAQPGQVTATDDPLTTLNGLSSNGLSTNGLSTNGLSTNGLSTNGLSNQSFLAWFNSDPVNAGMLMKYVAKCAFPAGTSLQWTNPVKGDIYSWPGELGLAPGWANGSAATEAEQQVISACLGAHTNKFGVHVNIAVEGTDATGNPVPRAPDELTTYSLHEGCFFGNLFRGEGVYAALDHTAWDPHFSSLRKCAFDSSSQCAPLVNLGSCAQYCQIDSTGTYYTSCRYLGKSYIPLTTRLMPQTLSQCGDGVCQPTEQCGTGTSSDSCFADCGPCS